MVHLQHVIIKDLQNLLSSDFTSDKSLHEKGLVMMPLTLLHSERPKLYGVLAILSAIGLSFRSY